MYEAIDVVFRFVWLPTMGLAAAVLLRREVVGLWREMFGEPW